MTQASGGESMRGSRSPRVRLKIWIGTLMSRLMPARARILREEFTLPYWNPDVSNGVVDRLIRLSLAHREFGAGGDGALEDLHKAFWRHQASGGWYAATTERFHKRYLPGVRPWVEILAGLVKDRSIQTVCEVGTGNGLFIRFLREQLPGPRRFIGLDLSEDQIAQNRQHFEGEGIEFLAGDAAAWIDDNLPEDVFYVAMGGVFEYFSQASLEELLRRMGESRGKVLLAIFFEPVALDHDLESGLDSRTYGAEYSMSHNYPHLLEKHGFRILRQELNERDEYHELMLIAELTEA